MSVGDQGPDISPGGIDLSDLGTVPEDALEADRANPDRRAERKAALKELDELERAGRLLLG